MTDKIELQTPYSLESICEKYFDNSLEGLAYCRMIYDAQNHPADVLFIRVNKSFEKLSDLEEVVGRKITEFFPKIKTTNSELFEIYNRVLISGKPETVETHIKSLSKWFLITVYGIDHDFFLFSIQNITDRKQIIKDLENAKVAARNVLEDLQIEKDKLDIAKAKDEALLESIGDAVFACDLDGKITLFNKVAEQLTGIAAKEAIGQHYLEVVTFAREGDEQPYQDWIAEALASNKTTRMPDHVVLLRKDGQQIAVADSAAPIRDSNGRPAGIVVVFRNFTQEREIERIKTDFISIASHQLRTPVSGMNWLIEALQLESKGFSAKPKKYVKDLGIFSRRLIKILEDLLNLSRVELKTKIVTAKDEIKIQVFLAEFVNEMKTYADLKKHSVIFKDEAIEPLTVEINKRSLTNVLQNLASNAIDYSPPNTAITIRLEKNNNFLKILVSNKGPAIPKKDQPGIWQRFYRSERARKVNPEGTGLGLYITKAIIEASQGNVGFESQAGQETVFWLTLPLKK